ncbi:MAG: YdeI/OmpD-associated family protein [Nitrospira sp.]|nr:YdeI/OmpD-associated family protein [Nitrospira sp.]
MPGFVSHALEERGVMEAYKQRPAYQQNDYLAWIMRARREKTRQHRLGQMLDELAAGGLYMRMTHAPSMQCRPDA